MIILHLPHLYVAPSPRGGRGVFTALDIPAATIIELSPAIILSAADRALVHQTRLHDFYFQWNGNRAAIALGLGSLYNHNDVPNAAFSCDYEFEQIRFVALKDIAAGEEITTNYRSGAPEMELWFEEE